MCNDYWDCCWDAVLEEYDSELLTLHCVEHGHDSEIVKLLSTDSARLEYCIRVADVPELYLCFEEDDYKVAYCEFNDRKEVWSTIENDRDIVNYCMWVENRKQLADKLTKKKYQYKYCGYLEDREWVV